MVHEISAHHLTIADIGAILREKKSLQLGETARQKIADCRAYLDRKMAETDQPIYGINTGFGSLCDTKINRADLEQLQSNLVMSHACGTGREVDSAIAKLMLLLKIQGLSYGHSGVRVEVVERLIWFYNEDILPVVYEQGSLGASGDLAPLAHLSLPLLGLGEVRYKGEKMSTESVLKSLDVEPLSLRSKEGLALLNGTQFMSAFGVHSLLKVKRLLDWADLIAAMSIEAFDARPEPFKKEVHEIRHHSGQKIVAANIRKILVDSKSFSGPKIHVQDPYSFRCIPQVHGASRDAIAFVEGVFENEINAVTDNPTVFPDSDDIISAGNFHGQPLALALDFLAIATAELGSISERRTYKLVGGTRKLPAFLVANPGLNSGFMIPQYTAASIVSRNKQLCTPSSVDTIDSSNGQEDHVSMGANGAVKALEVVQNTETVLGIELMNATQALELRGLQNPSENIKSLHSAFRKRVAFVKEDRTLYPCIESARAFVSETQPEQWMK
jgi:histidine ammonia-lyase